MPNSEISQEILHQLQTLRFLPESERTGYYDEVVAPAIEQYAATVQANPSEANIREWLALQSAATGLAVEGITEITEELKERASQPFQAALSALPLEARVPVDWLLRELEGQENLPQDIIEQDELAAAARRDMGAPELAGPQAANGVLGEFRGTGTFTSTRGHPVIRGTFTLFNAGGARLGRWTANTGGGAANYRTTNGPLPPGIFRVSNHRPNRTTAGMVLNGVGFSFDVNPASGTGVYGRSLFRIHPDGGSEGTNGCLGIRESAGELENCEASIAGLIAAGSAFKISVRY